MVRRRPRLGIALVAAALLGCDVDRSLDSLGADAGEPVLDDPRACAGPGSPLGLGAREWPPTASLLPPDPDAACLGKWLGESLLPATWTVEVGEGFGYNAGWQLAAHPEGGVVFAIGSQIGRIDGAGELLWLRSGPEGIDDHDLHVDAQGRTIGLGKAGGESLQILVLDGEGELVELVDLGEVGSNNLGHLVPWQGDYFVATASSESWKLMRVHPSGELLLDRSLELGLWLPVLAIDDAGNVLYGDEPTRVLDIEGHIQADLGKLPEFEHDWTWIDVPHRAVGLDDGFLVAGPVDARLRVSSLDGQGDKRWMGIRYRGDHAGRAAAIARSGSGGVVVGAESIAWNDYDEFIGSEQPLVLAFDAAGELLWEDRIAAIGAALDVAVAPEGTVYVAGYAEFAATEGPYAVGMVGWVRRYDP